LEAISFGQVAAADQRGGDADEGREVLGFAFVAAVQAAEAVEPGDGALDRSAVAAELLGDSTPLRARRGAMFLPRSHRRRWS